MLLRGAGIRFHSIVDASRQAALRLVPNSKNYSSSARLAWPAPRRPRCDTLFLLRAVRGGRVLLLVLLVPGLLWAQVEDPQWEIAAQVGGFFFLKDLGRGMAEDEDLGAIEELVDTETPELLLGLRLAYAPMDWLAVEGEVAFSPASATLVLSGSPVERGTVAPGATGSLDLSLYDLRVRAYPWGRNGRTFSPYLYGGLGLVHRELEFSIRITPDRANAPGRFVVAEVEESHDDLLGTGGIGLAVDLLRGSALQLEVGDYISSFELEDATTSKTQHDLAITAGWTLRF